MTPASFSDENVVTKYAAFVPVSTELLIDAGLLPWLDRPVPFPRIVLFPRAAHAARWVRTVRYEVGERTQHAWSALRGESCGGDEW